MPYPTSPQVDHITFPPWNQMNVAVHYRLACIAAMIDSNIYPKFYKSRAEQVMKPINVEATTYLFRSFLDPATMFFLSVRFITITSV
jgi:hypothetical protein